MTIKQKRLARVVEKSRTMGEALLKAGYSPATAIKPTQVTKSKGWQKLMEEQLPDEELLVATKEGLKANKIISSHTEPDYEYPDHAIRLKSADQGYKLKGRYSDIVINQQFNTENMEIEFISNEK